LNTQRIAHLGGLMALVASLAACVVVPLDPKTGQPYPTYAPPPPPVVVVQPSAHSPAPAMVHVRLYPANEAARQVGLIAATVLDNGQGRGTFNVSYGSASLQGEATRVDRNYPGWGEVLNRVQGGHSWPHATGARGIANAAGGASHNSVSIRCEYLFSSSSQGTGACEASDGARFQMHFGG
jgi:hypothetical protein